MLRGYQKRIYYVRNPESPFFSEAMFTLKSMPQAPSDTELAEEAKRLVSHMSAAPSARTTRPILGKLAVFMIGAASSSALIGCIALLVAFT